MVITVATGCRDDGGGTHRSADSAGVSIVTSLAPTWGDSVVWSVDTTPALSIGDATDRDAVLLIGVSGVRLLEDGRLAVVSNDQKAVLYFSAAGRSAGRAGRAGLPRVSSGR